MNFIKKFLNSKSPLVVLLKWILIFGITLTSFKFLIAWWKKNMGKDDQTDTTSESVEQDLGQQQQLINSMPESGNYISENEAKSRASAIYNAMQSNSWWLDRIVKWSEISQYFRKPGYDVFDISQYTDGNANTLDSDSLKAIYKHFGLRAYSNWVGGFFPVQTNMLSYAKRYMYEADYLILETLYKNETDIL